MGGDSSQFRVVTGNEAFITSEDADIPVALTDLQEVSQAALVLNFVLVREALAVRLVVAIEDTIRVAGRRRG